MDAIRCILLILIAMEFASASIVLTTSTANGTVGVDFTFTCTTTILYFIFTIGNSNVCTIIGGYPNGTCVFAGNHTNSYSYNCNNSTGVYKLTIPGSFDIDTLHGSNCKCRDAQGSVESNIVHLNVNVPIKQVQISATPDDKNPIDIKEYSPQQFQCITDAGRPSSFIKWYISGIIITSSVASKPDVCISGCNGKVKSTSVLTYVGSRSNDGQNIYCIAQNTDSSSQRSQNRTVVILYSPSTPTITQSPNTSVNENTMIQFTCEILGGNPLAVITWTCNGATPFNIPGSVRNDKSISQVQLLATKEIDGKKCTCTGSHPAWTQINYASLMLNIRYAPGMPSIIQQPGGPIIEGTNVVLTCEIPGGNPLATISWICVGIAFTPQTISPVSEKVLSRIELNITRQHDGKECICRGKHPIWTKDEEIKHPFNVYFSPTTYPSISQAPPGVVDEGTNITLTCRVSGGKPLAVLSWQCNGSLPSTSTPSPPTNTSLSSVQLTVNRNNNRRECICVGFHPAWEQNQSFSIELDVRYPPEVFSEITQTPSGTIVEDNMVILTCEIDGGNPLANISWQCVGFTPYSPTANSIRTKIVSSIMKRNVSKEDNGKNCSCIGYHRLWLPNKRTKDKTLHVYYSTTIQIVNERPIILIENRTLVLVCTEIDGNPRNASFTWYKANNYIESKSNHSIRNATAKDAGNYTCHGSNSFGRRSEDVVEVVVLYSPRVSTLSALYGSTIAENDLTVLQCSVHSNPSPTIEWMKHGNSALFHGIGNQYQSNLTISPSSCMDTGNYTCKAKNIIDNNEYTTMKDIELFVNCSPRLYDQQVGSTNSIGLAVGQDLTIREHILSYPIGNINWFFKKDENTSEEILHSASDCGIYTIFDHQICLSRLNLTENDFGLYSVVIVNDIGNATFTYTVDPQGKPYISTDVNVTCGKLKAEISWTTAYNGGQQQKFYILTTNNDDFQFIHSTGKFGNKKGVTQRLSLPMPAGPFSFAVFGNNSFGNATAKGDSCEVQGIDEKDSILGLAAGLGSSMAVLLIIIFAAVIFFRKRISKKKGDDTTLFKRSKSKTYEDDDDTLTDNPLYVTSEIHDDKESGQVYSTVDKTKKRGLEEPVSFKVDLQGPVYSEVKKNGKKAIRGDKQDGSGQKMLRKEKKGKTSTELEMGNVYGNADSIPQDNNGDGVYANAENTSKNSNKLYIPKKNKDGLIYADLELDNYTTGRKFVIRGLENKTNYAIIDLNVKVDPLPSDDDDNEGGNQEQTNNGQNNQDI